MATSEAGWPGLFSHGRVHRVVRTEVAALRGMGLADCGAVCMPADDAPVTMREFCQVCTWPDRHWPEESPPEEGAGLSG